MMQLLTRALREETGQDLIEYSMLAGFISLVAIAFIRSIGVTISEWYTGFAATVATIPSGS
jgi:Flp pilus assembly pilin Flp